MVTCKETMFRGDPWHPRREPCGRREWKDGMCKTHHPEAKAARKAKRGPSEWERRQDVIATLRAENARLTAELALRKDCADQVRAASATITRLARELEVCERPLRAEIARQAERIAELEAMNTSRLEDVAVLLKAFDDGLFVRDTKGDGDPRWAIKLLTPLAAMARLQRTIDAALAAAKGE